MHTLRTCDTCDNRNTKANILPNRKYCAFHMKCTPRCSQLFATLIKKRKNTCLVYDPLIHNIPIHHTHLQLPESYQAHKKRHSHKNQFYRSSTYDALSAVESRSFAALPQRRSHNTQSGACAGFPTTTNYHHSIGPKKF